MVNKPATIAVFLITFFSITTCHLRDNPIDSGGSNYNGYDSVDLDGDGIGQWRDVDDIQPISPANSATLDTGAPTLTISMCDPTLVNQYWIQISSSNSDFVGNIVYEKNDNSTSVCVLPNGRLLNNTTYYWRAKAFDGTKWSDNWTTPRGFTVNVSVVIPVNPLPANAGSAFFPTPLLDWEDISLARVYHIQVNTNSSFSGTVIADDSSLTASQMQMSTLSFYPVTYYWRVRIQDAALQWSAWSNTWSFVVDRSGDRVVRNIAGINFAMRYVQSGSYYVGDNPPGANNVTLTKSYWIAETELTYDLWYAVKIWAEGHGYYLASSGVDGFDSAGEIIGGTLPHGSRQPVVGITWKDAIVWCNALSQQMGYTPVYYTDSGCTIPQKNSLTTFVDTTLGSVYHPYVDWNANGFRLPTEAEWEIAARGGYIAVRGGTYGFTYSGSNDIDEVGWYSGNSDDKTHPVNSKTPNQLGICDMSGNVSEWTWDIFSDPYPSSGTDPRGEIGDIMYRSVRGGGCSDGSSWVALQSRGPFNSGAVSYTLSMRIVCNN